MYGSLPRLRVLAPWSPGALANALFLIFFTVNSIRLFRHALWRDEMQAFLLAAYSKDLSHLFDMFSTEGHPGLWYALLWIITRISDDPLGMKLTQLLLAGGTWLIIYRFSPFSTVEKFLLLVGYFLSFEFFVLSRGYVLVPLLGFGFICWRAAYPQSRVVGWLLLALLANSEVFGTIWALMLALSYSWQHRRNVRALAIGWSIFFPLLAVAIASMLPSRNVEGSELAIGIEHFVRVAKLFAETVIPLHPYLLEWLGNPDFSKLPTYWAGKPGNAPITSFHLTVLAGATLLLARDLRNLLSGRFIELALSAGGVLLFFYVYPTAQSQRHLGMLFVVIVGSFWALRYKSIDYRPAWWFALLIGNLVASAATLPFEGRPFSHGRDVASWLVKNNLEKALVMASPEFAAQPIIGYLGKPIVMLECSCKATSIKAMTAPHRRLTGEDDALSRARDIMMREGAGEAVLVLNRPISGKTAGGASSAELSIAISASFIGAEVWDEDFYVYIVRLK